MKLPTNAYGDATGGMQRLLDEAVGLEWFRPGADRATAVTAWTRHLASLRAAGCKVPNETVAIWFGGPHPGSAVELDGSGEVRRDGERRGWFEALNRLAPMIEKRFVESGRLELVGPPLWAFPRTTGIRNGPVIATARAAVECKRRFPLPTDEQAAWSVLCLAEEILALCLGWECAFADAGLPNPLASVLDVYASGAIPMGWDSGNQAGFYVVG